MGISDGLRAHRTDEEGDLGPPSSSSLDLTGDKITLIKYI